MSGWKSFDQEKRENINLCKLSHAKTGLPLLSIIQNSENSGNSNNSENISDNSGKSISPTIPITPVLPTFPVIPALPIIHTLLYRIDVGFVTCAQHGESILKYKACFSVS